MVGAVSKISAFQPQGPRFDPGPAQPKFEHLRDLLFRLRSLSFHPSEVGKWAPASVKNLPVMVHRPVQRESTTLI